MHHTIRLTGYIGLSGNGLSDYLGYCTKGQLDYWAKV